MNNDFFTFSRQTIAQQTANGHPNVAHNREASLRCLEQFLGRGELSIGELSSHIVERFKDWLIANGRKESTARLYINQISAMYNAAVKEGIAPQQRLLQGVNSAMPARHVRPLLPEDELRRLRYADLSDSKSLSFARDMFLFSIYGRGINFADIAYIKKSDIKGFTLTYTSHISNPPRVTVPWDVAMQEIADRYPSPTDFLFPILTSGDKFQASRDIKRVRENVMNGLKKIALRYHLSAVPSLYMSKDIYLRALGNVCVSKLI